LRKRLFPNLKPLRRIKRALRAIGLLAGPEKPKKGAKGQAARRDPARSPVKRAPVRQPERVHLPARPEVRIYNKSRLHVRRVKDFPHFSMQGRSPEVTLRRGVALLDEMKGPASDKPMWWVGVGTALGLSRDGAFIADDTDIDVRIGLDYAHPEEARAYMAYVIETFGKAGFKLVREMYWDRRPMQSALLDTRNNDILFDIYYFHRGLTEGCYVNFNDSGYREKPAHLVDNRARVAWPGQPDLFVYAPHPTEEYNAWRFGPEWRIRKKPHELTAVDTQCIRPLPRGTVLTYGTFDIFHVGHARLLRRASALGDRLVVGVVSDELCRIKGKPIVNSELHRAEVAAASGHVDTVFIQREMEQKEKDIDRFEAKRLVVGDDWKDHPRFERVRGYHGVEIVYLSRTEGISSTMLRSLGALPGRATGR
jgi:glycerol-3-phosphate cytidylyltransferase